MMSIEGRGKDERDDDGEFSPLPITGGDRLEDDDPCVPTRVSPTFRSPVTPCARPTSNRTSPLFTVTDAIASTCPGREEEALGLPVPLEARKNQCAWVCWVSAAEEVPFGVEG